MNALSDADADAERHRARNDRRAMAEKNSVAIEDQEVSVQKRVDEMDWTR